MRAAWLLFRTLNLGYFGSHRTRNALSVLGIALGVMLIFGILILNVSLTSSYAQSRSDVQGAAQLEVTSNGTAGLDSSLVDRLQKQPGVRVVAPILVQGTQVRGPRGTVQATAFGFDKDSLKKLAAQVTEDRRVHVIHDQPGLVVPQQLLDRLGRFPDQTLTIVYRGRTTPLPVVAVVDADLGAQLNGGRFVGLPLKEAQRIFEEPRRVTSILLKAADPSPAAVDRLRRTLTAQLGPGALVQPVSLSQQQLNHSTATIQTFSTFVSVVALLVGAYLVFNTMSVAAAERRREASTLLALGEAGRQLTVRFLAEAAVLGAAGTALGLAGGYLLGGYLVQQTPRYIEDAYTFTAVTVIPAWTFAVAAGTGVAAAVLAAVFPARSFLRVPPAEALRPQPLGEAPIDRRLQIGALAAGLVLTALGVAGSLVERSAGALFLAPVFAGFVLMTPALFTWSTRLAAAALIGSRLRVASGVTRLAGANLLQSPRRTVATLSATAFSLALVVTIGGTIANVQSSINGFADHFRRFDLYVSATDDTYVSVPVDPSAQEAIRSLAGVSDVYALRSTFVTWRDERIWLLGEDPAALRHLGLLFHGGDPESAVASLDGDGMLISTQLAALQGVGVGDRMDLQTPAGPRSFHVTGVIEELAWPEGTVMIGNGQFVDAFRQPAVNQVVVRLAPGASPAAARTAIHARMPDAAVLSGGELVDSIHQQQSAQFAPFVQVRNVAVVVAILTVFNSMLISVIQRLREIGVQRAMGVLASEVAASLVLEAVAMLTVALVAGVVLGSLMQALGIQFLATAAGLPVQWSFAAGPILEGAAAAAITVLAGSLYPARRASQVPVLEAIAYE